MFRTPFKYRSAFESSVVKIGGEVLSSYQFSSISHLYEYLESRGVLNYDKDIVRIKIEQYNNAQIEQCNDAEFEQCNDNNDDDDDGNLRMDEDSIDGNPIDFDLLILSRRSQLSADELFEIDKCLSSPKKNFDSIVVTKYADVSVSHLMCLRPLEKLNDVVIDYYMCLLQDRDAILTKLSGKRRVASHFFGSFFISKLLNVNTKYEVGEYTYSNVARWTKNFNVFEKNKLFFPTNLRNSHWVMIVIYMQLKEIHYYDSCNDNGIERYLKPVLRWLKEESETKYGGFYDNELNDWHLVDQGPNVPQQNNDKDCGVFSILAADFLSDDIPLTINTYHQEEILTYRLRICASILRGKIFH